MEKLGPEYDDVCLTCGYTAAVHLRGSVAACSKYCMTVGVNLASIQYLERRIAKLEKAAVQTSADTAPATGKDLPNVAVLPIAQIVNDYSLTFEDRVARIQKLVALAARSSVCACSHRYDRHIADSGFMGLACRDCICADFMDARASETFRVHRIRDCMSAQQIVGTYASGDGATASPLQQNVKTYMGMSGGGNDSAQLEERRDQEWTAGDYARLSWWESACKHMRHIRGSLARIPIDDHDMRIRDAIHYLNRAEKRIMDYVDGTGESAKSVETKGDSR